MTPRFRGETLGGNSPRQSEGGTQPTTGWESLTLCIPEHSLAISLLSETPAEQVKPSSADTARRARWVSTAPAASSRSSSEKKAAGLAHHPLPAAGTSAVVPPPWFLQWPWRRSARVSRSPAAASSNPATWLAAASSRISAKSAAASRFSAAAVRSKYTSSTLAFSRASAPRPSTPATSAPASR